MKTPLLVVSICLATALSPPANGHVGDRIYPIYEIPDESLPNPYDGTLEEWPIEPILDRHDFIPLNTGYDFALHPSDLLNFAKLKE